MNIYGIIILSTLLLGFILKLVADFLNIKNLGNKIPQELEDVYCPRKYEKSCKYTKTRTKLGIISSTFGLLLLIVFWFTGGFNYVDEIARCYSNNYLWQGLIFTGILMFGCFLLSLPFSIQLPFLHQFPPVLP